MNSHSRYLRLAAFSLVLFGIPAVGLGQRAPRDENRPPRDAAQSAGAQSAGAQSAGAQSAGAKANAKAQEQKRIAQWIANLDANRFVVRDRATTALEAAGSAAVAPLVAAVPTGSRELRTRVVSILQRFALSRDTRKETQAYRALVGLQKAPGLVGGQATKSLRIVHNVREQRALDHLLARGAELRNGFGALGLGVTYDMLTLEISEGWKGGDHDLQQLRWLRNVQEVVLRGEQVKDSWVRNAVRIPGLISLSIKRGQITDAVAEDIGSARGLKRLQLKYVAISDAAVPHLAQLKTAEKLQLFGTQISRAAAERLRNQLGTVQVDHRAGGFLGVGCLPHPLGCLVQEVHRGSAANQAGLVPGDVIVEYGGKKVQTFEDLTRWISTDAVGKPVAMKIARRMQIYTNAWAWDPTETLGIKGATGAAGLNVKEVAAESRARRFGLRAGDTVFLVNDTRTYSGNDLAAAVAKLQPGDNVVLRYARNGMLLTKKVTLGEWE